jgi:hypothetical protein
VSWETRFVRDRGLVIGEVVDVRVHPWWAVLGAYSLPLIGFGVSLWLLPEGRRLIDRFFARLGASFSARSTY